MASPDALPTFGRRFGALAALAPDAPAVTCGETTLSRRALDERSNRIARVLAARGVTPGGLVTIALPNACAFFEATLAVWKLGAVPQPVNPQLPEREFREIVSLARPQAIIGGQDLGSGIPRLPAELPVPPGVSAQPLDDVVSPSWKAPASGGSTGRPKVIRTTKPARFDEARVRSWLRGTHRCHLTPGPLYHDAPFASSVYGLLLGAHVVVMERFDALGMLQLVERHRVEFLLLVPTMMVRVMKLPEEARRAIDMSSLVVVMHGAAPCPAWVKERWIEWLGGERIWEHYSTTETVAATMIRGDEWLAHRGSVGRCFEGEIRVFDAEGRPLPAGESGLLAVRPDPRAGATFQYVGGEARVFEGGWITFGDIGSVDADGYVYVTDRETDMVVSGGVNIYPAEVEAALETHPLITMAAVIGLPDEDLGNRIHAIVNTIGPVTGDMLRDYLASHLNRHKIPRSFELVDEPLRDDAGKVRRWELRAARIAAAGARP